MKHNHWLKVNGLGFYGGPRKPAIEGHIEVGRGRMEILVFLTDEMLAQLALLAPIILAEPDSEQRGHAFHHWRSPQREYPCNECSEAVRAVKDKWAQRIEQHALPSGKAVPS